MLSANTSTTHFQPHYFMDWYSWLSKTGLDPTLVYEYGQAFSQNELEQDDLPYFNHEFLQSMGISIAKHRLEILKLARKDNATLPRSMSRILIAIKRTKRCFSKYLTRTWARHEKKSLAIVPTRSYSATTWRKALLKRNKKGMMVNKNSRAPLLLTNGNGSGTPMMFHSARIESFSSPMEHDDDDDDDQIERDDVDDDVVKGDGDEYDEYWSSAVEEIRWDTMFQNLKPT